MANSRTLQGTQLVTQSDRDDYDSLALSFKRSLLAANLSQNSIICYLDAVNFLGDFLVSQGMPLSPAAIHREHIEAFLTHLMTEPNSRTGKPASPATAATRYRALRVFFNWLLDMGEITRHPMERMKSPRLPQKPPPLLTEDQLRKLIKACEGKEFDERRDMALLRLLIDTGMRRTEIASLKLEDIDWDRRLAFVTGKGRKSRLCSFGAKTMRALDVYVNFARKHHPHSALPALWLSQRGALSSPGVMDIVKRRAQQAGVPGVHPHLFRHQFAHAWLAGGGQEQDLMVLAGWQSRAMLGRYSASAATERAREAYKRLSPGDKL
jgi:site-specific recombinase XerD